MAELCKAADYDGTNVAVIHGLKNQVSALKVAELLPAVTMSCDLYVHTVMKADWTEMKLSLFMHRVKSFHETISAVKRNYLAVVWSVRTYSEPEMSFFENRKSRKRILGNPCTFCLHGPQRVFADVHVVRDRSSKRS